MIALEGFGGDRRGCCHWRESVVCFSTSLLNDLVLRWHDLQKRLGDWVEKISKEQASAKLQRLLAEQQIPEDHRVTKVAAPPTGTDGNLTRPPLPASAKEGEGDISTQGHPQGPGVTEVTYYRSRQEYGGLKDDQVKRLKDLEAENARLRKAVSALIRSAPPGAQPLVQTALMHEHSPRTTPWGLASFCVTGTPRQDTFCSPASRGRPAQRNRLRSRE